MCAGPNGTQKRRFARCNAFLNERGVINLEIRVHDNDVEKAIKLLKRLIQKEGILGELKKRRYYEKPSVKLRRKQREARKRKAKSSRSRR